MACYDPEEVNPGETVESGIPRVWDGGLRKSQRKQAEPQTPPFTSLSLPLPYPHLQSCLQTSGFQILPMTSQLSLSPTISPRRDSSDRSSAPWCCLPATLLKISNSFSSSPLGCNGGRASQGSPLLPHSPLLPCPPTPVLHTAVYPHWPVERYSNILISPKF